MRHEIANLLTHGIGAGLAIAGTAFLIVKGAIIGDPWRTVSYSLFGASMVFYTWPQACATRCGTPKSNRFSAAWTTAR
jgi:hemolysin III